MRTAEDVSALEQWSCGLTAAEDNDGKYDDDDDDNVAACSVHKRMPSLPLLCINKIYSLFLVSAAKPPSLLKVRYSTMSYYFYNFCRMMLCIVWPIPLHCV